MIIVIPIGSTKERSTLKLLTEAIICLGPVTQPVLLAAVPSMLADAEDAAKQLRSVCSSVRVVSTDNEFAHGWFRGPNRMFHWVVTHLELADSHEPFLWLEVDACPVVKGWASKLEKDYQEAGMPHFGFIRPTNHKRPDGSIFTKEGDNMLLGVSIYPPHMLKNPALAPLLRNLSIENERSHAPYPWDIYCRWQFFKKGVHSTHLIYDRWCTVNYRRDFGALVCDPHPDFPTAQGGVIPAEALLVHGCKDETLHKLVIQENGGAKQVVAATVAPPPPPPPRPVKIDQIPPAIIQAQDGGPKRFYKIVDPVERVKAIIKAMNDHNVTPRLTPIAKAAKLDKAFAKEIILKLGYEVVSWGKLQTAEI